MEDEAAEVNEKEAEREGAESPTGSLHTVDMVEGWFRAMRLQPATDLEEVEQAKLQRFSQKLDAVEAAVQSLTEEISQSDSRFTRILLASSAKEMFDRIEI